MTDDERIHSDERRYRRVPRRDQIPDEDAPAFEHLPVGSPLEFDEAAHVPRAQQHSSFRRALDRWREKREHRNFASDEEWGVDDE